MFAVLTHNVAAADRTIREANGEDLPLSVEMSKPFLYTKARPHAEYMSKMIRLYWKGSRLHATGPGM